MATIVLRMQCLPSSVTVMAAPPTANCALIVRNATVMERLQSLVTAIAAARHGDCNRSITVTHSVPGYALRHGHGRAFLRHRPQQTRNHDNKNRRPAVTAVTAITPPLSI